MKIQKAFTYQGQEHSVVFEKKSANFQLTLDGVLCQSVKGGSFLGIPNVKAEISLNEEALSIFVYGKQIYILRNDLDIETGLPFAYPTARKKPLVRLPSFVLYCLHLFYVVIFYKRFIDFDQIGEDFLKLMSFIALAWVMLAVSVIGIRQYFYFIDHPSLDKHEKAPKIVLSVILVNLINTGLLILMNKVF